RIGQLEQICIRILADSNEPVVSDSENVQERNRPMSGSRAWYAKTILMSIGAVRLALQHSNIQLALSEAVELGAWATEAQAKYQWADLLLLEARTRKNRALSQRAAVVRRAQATERDKDIQRHAQQYRARHRDVTREHSTRSMAKHIARALEMKEGTVRDRLR